MGPQKPDDLIIKTERLTLRPRVKADADALHASFSDPELMKYWSRPPTTSLEETRTYVTNNLERNVDLCCLWSIDYEGSLAGTVDLFGWHDDMMELGYLVAKQHQGKGLSYEAAKAVVDFGFGKLDLHRIEAQLHPDNAASSGLLEKLGFQREGHLRLNYCIEGTYSDTLIYGLLASDPRP